jgi:hypothetical protein
MRPMNFLMVSAAGLLLSSCGVVGNLRTPEPEIVTVTETVPVVVPKATPPKDMRLENIRIYVVSEDENINEFKETFRKIHGEVVFVAISIKDYENMSLNIAEMKRYIDQQKQVILYYESALTEEN